MTNVSHEIVGLGVMSPCAVGARTRSEAESLLGTVCQRCRRKHGAELRISDASVPHVERGDSSLAAAVFSAVKHA
jgi:hypothetical protein